MTELVLDSNIRVWVFLPIVVITFLLGIVRHYLSILLTPRQKNDLQQIIDSQAMIRARILRNSGSYIPKQSFLMRRYYFNNEETGYFVTQKCVITPPNPITDPSIMTDMLKENVTNVLTMVVIGGWINVMFSGFVATKLPFPVTLRFKHILQRDIMIDLDAAWVSSASWYFLNAFGLPRIYTLIFRDSNIDQMGIKEATIIMTPTDPKNAFKAEWEALEVYNYNWGLASVQNEIINYVDQNINCNE